MLISIVIPSHNDYRILKTINSIISQKFDLNKIEIIIIDNLSEKKLLNQISIKLKDLKHLIVSEKDEGIFDAINKGIKKAKGRYIYTIGSDDFINKSNFLFDIKSKIEEENPDIIFFGIQYTLNNGKVFRKWPPHKFNLLNKMIGKQFAHFGMICRKDVFKKFGLFNYKNKISADLEFFLKLPIKNNKYSYLNKYYVNMHFGGNSSKNLLRIVFSNFIMGKFILLNYPLYFPGFILKPIHKLREIFIY